MRIIHTSDWHLGCRVRNISRRDHIRARLLEIAAYLKEHAVDVLVVSGDVFHKKHHRVEELQEAVEDVHQAFGEFLRRGGHVVAISGNHDHEALFALLHKVVDMASPGTGRRLHLGAAPGLLRLRDAAGQEVQFVLLPYPTPRRYLDAEEAVVSSPEERHILLQRKLVSRLEHIQARLDPRLPSVLVAHTHVRGSRLSEGKLYEMELTDDVIFETAHTGNFTYSAYGHIHLPQALPGNPHARYAGSIERLNKDERHDEKSVVLVEITGSSRALPQPLPLHPTPMDAVTILDPDVDLQELSDRYPDPETILYYTLDLPPEARREEVHQDIHRRFKNAIQESLLTAAEATPAAPADREAQELTAWLRDVPATVERYLAERLRESPHRERALQIVRQILQRQEQEVLL
jgi:exonuclease SbcD